MDRLNYFNLYDSKASSHEDQLTRAYLVLLKHSSHAFFAFIDYARRFRIGEMRSYAETNWLKFVEQMGYPKDLPNLNDQVNKPQYHDKPDGVVQSYF